MTTTIINQNTTANNSFSSFATRIARISSAIKNPLRFDFSLDLDKNLMEEITTELIGRND